MNYGFIHRAFSCRFHFHNFPSVNTALFGFGWLEYTSYPIRFPWHENAPFLLQKQQGYEMEIGWLRQKYLVLVIILFNSNNWSIDLFGIVTRKFAPRTIGRWCGNTKIIVDFGAFDPAAVIIFLHDWRFIIFLGFGWLECTCYLIRFHMKMLHSFT